MCMCMCIHQSGLNNVNINVNPTTITITINNNKIQIEFTRSRFINATDILPPRANGAADEINKLTHIHYRAVTVLVL